MSLAYRFFIFGVLFALTGMGMGTYMGASHDFTLAPVHAHINLVGWATHFLFGLYYRGEPANARGLLPELQFLCAVGGGILLPLGVVGAVTGGGGLEIAILPGTAFTLGSMMLFLAVVLRGRARLRSALPEAPLMAGAQAPI